MVEKSYLAKEVTLGLRSEKHEEAGLVNMWERHIPGRGKRLCVCNGHSNYVSGTMQASGTGAKKGVGRGKEDTLGEESSQKLSILADYNDRIKTEVEGVRYGGGGVVKWKRT